MRIDPPVSVPKAMGTMSAATTTPLADDDYAHMRKVVGYVRRHLAHRPENMVTSRWRYSLMNWGHDPLKEG